MKRLFGVTTAMLTPRDADGNVIKEYVEQHVSFLIGAGINCLYPLGSTGEMIFLSETERKKTAGYVINACKGRATVFIHVGAPTLEETIRLAKHAVEAGADGIGAVTPYYFHLSNAELFNYYSYLAESLPADFPIYLYNIPQCTTNDISSALARALAESYPNIIGIKYSSPDMIRTMEYQEINKGRFSVVQGTDTLFDISLLMGCDGVVSGISSAFPEPFVKIYSAYCKGEFGKLHELQKLVNPLIRTIVNGNGIYNLKLSLELRGLPIGPRKSELMKPSDKYMQELSESLKMGGWI